MKISNPLVSFVLLVLFSISARAQGLAINEWRDHLPYNHCIVAAEARSRIYCATPYSLFYYDKADNSLQRLNKISGLSDMGISFIRYNKEYDILVITYVDANIDLLKNNSVINISDIKRKIIPGNKTINRVTMQGPYAYLSCGFGIVVLDLIREEVRDTYYIGPEGSPINVFDITMDDSRIFAATEKGIYSASLNSPNLVNYAEWSKDSLLPHPDARYNLILSYNSKIYTNLSRTVYYTDTMYVSEGSSWQKYQPQNTSNKTCLESNYGKLVIVGNDLVDVFDQNDSNLLHVWTYNPGFPQPTYAIADKDGTYWITDLEAGLVKNWRPWSFDQILLNGPYSASIYVADCQGSDLCFVPGGMNQSWQNMYYVAEVFRFSDEKWTSLNKRLIPGLDSLRDFVSVAIDPLDHRRMYAGTWGYGLCEFYEDSLVKIYNSTNSSLRPPAGLTATQVEVGGLCFDSDHNLWATNANAAGILSMRSAAEGTWRSFSIGSLVSGGGETDVGRILIDNYGQKWMLLRGARMLVFSDNGTYTNSADDKAKILNSSLGLGNLPGSFVRCMAKDLDGEIWVGTDAGVVVFYTPEDILTSQPSDAQQILVKEGLYWEPLFGSEDVTAIAVDGANRKWIGTDRAGVFLMSADGTEQIYHFDEENSPLFSNSISSITIDDITGEVFFGTANGMISFKSTATKGGETNENVFAYPNPVRPDYSGPIAIKGLVRDADVKITDISGNLIYSTKAEGGQAVWYGKNFSGDRAHSGVYLVFITNADGTQKEVAKILVVN